MTDSPFDRLHPAVQYHLVNSLGWRSLRPFQLAAIDPILEGRDALILAPTAGGKTEAAFVPVLSKMLSAQQSGLSVLYVCPIKALLNNLEPRLSGYAALVGRTVGIWHGDISDSRKAQMRRNPPDVLLTTPESLEGLLISTRADRRVVFGSLRVVIIDELHAFAGDDRGWHMRAVLKRLERYAPKLPQRIGLSATVGNPSELLQWFSGTSDAVVVGDAAPPAGGELMVDFVGSLESAAKVISRLYRGDKRLVFCDSRSKVESLATMLRQADVKTFVSHSSLSVSERKAAEAAFSEERDCVIVATSTLELGIDVGDLDRVLQIDAPSTVSSLLQRMGRTGRRQGMPRNCTFLATNDESLMVALALCRLLAQGYTEPVNPPADAWHIVAQQAMALVLERSPVGFGEVLDVLVAQFSELDRAGIKEVLAYLLAKDFLTEQDDLLGFGVHGEREFGARNFLELVSSFTTPTVLLVQFGVQELGYVDPISVQSRDGQAVLSLGGHGWRVQSVDWKRRVVWVEPSVDEGRSSWLGLSRAISAKVAAAVKDSLIEDVIGCVVSKRAASRLEVLSKEFDFVSSGATDLLKRRGRDEWWTFAGGAANAVLVSLITSLRRAPEPRFDDLALDVPVGFEAQVSNLSRALDDWVPTDFAIERFAKELKFWECLPPSFARACICARFYDVEGAKDVVCKPVVSHILQDE